jgi:hypothetical protein
MDLSYIPIRTDRLRDSKRTRMYIPMPRPPRPHRQKKIKSKRKFIIEWPEDCGPAWMNVSNLMLCLTTKEHISQGVCIRVTDITDIESLSSLIREANYRTKEKNEEDI